jgi:hypothetical protein
MKHLLKGLILATAMVFIALSTYSQTIGFGYDESGNRTSRQIIILKRGEANLQESIVTETLDNFLITISPNPNGGKFSLTITDESGQFPASDTPVKLSVFSLRGDQLYQLDQLETSNQIDISNHPNGTYILTLVYGAEKRTWKIIKQ